VAKVTVWVAGLSFAAGVATLVFGVRVGHAQSALSSHLAWGLVSVLLQLSTAVVAFVHGRASSREADVLRAELERRPEADARIEEK
jgi:hypothetical protein